MNILNTDLLRFNRNYRICNKHFVKTNFRAISPRLLLVDSAVPTLESSIKTTEDNTASSEAPTSHSEQTDDGTSSTSTSFTKNNDSGSLYDPSSFCRLCATEVVDTVPIFDSDDMNVLSKIIKYLPVVLRSNDLLPKQVCHSCLSKLNISAELSEGCVEADRKLKEIFEGISTDKMSQCSDEKQYNRKKLLDKAGRVSENPRCASPEDESQTERDLRQNICNKSSETKCTFCCALFPDKDIFEEHKKQFQCETCDYTICRIDFYEIHSEYCKTRLKYRKCKLCNQVFETRTVMKEHFVICRKSKMRCKVCDKSFSDWSKLTNHENKHTGINPYLCDKCGKNFRFSKSLKSHVCKEKSESGSTKLKSRRVNKKGSLKTHKCDRCDKCFKSKSSLRDHMYFHNGIKPYKCVECGKRYSIRASLTAHKLTQHNVRDIKMGPFTCDTCGKVFIRLGSLKAHTRIHTLVKRFHCELCGKTYRKNSTLEDHMMAHNNVKPYVCEICGMCFSYGPNLKRHKLLHLGDRKYKCDECCAAFTMPSALKLHKLGHTGEKSYMCQYCGKAFARHINLKGHILKHHSDVCDTLSGPLPTKCAKCYRIFYSLKSLETHSETCNGERQYKCDLCEQRFNYRIALKEHMYTHTGEKPYKCPTCAKRFRMSASLYQHKKIHGGIKKYACEYCSKRFLRKSGIDGHRRRMHTDGKYFECKFCCQKFTKRDMVKHKCKDTGEKPFTCESCQESFQQEVQLSDHQKHCPSVKVNDVEDFLSFVTLS